MNARIRQAKRDLNLTTDNDLESMFIEKLLSILADLPIPNENIGKINKNFAGCFQRKVIPEVKI